MTTPRPDGIAPRPLVEALRQSRADAPPRETRPREPRATANDDHRAAEKILPLLQESGARRAWLGPLVALAWLVVGLGLVWSLGIAEMPVARAAVIALSLLALPPVAILALVQMAQRLGDIRGALGPLAQVVIGLADRDRAERDLAPQAIAGVARDIHAINDALEQVATRIKSFEHTLSSELIRAEQSIDAQRTRLEEAVSGLDASMRLTAAAVEDRLADFDARLVAGMGRNVAELDTQVDEALRTLEAAMTRGSQGAIESIRAEVAAIEDGLRGELFRFAEGVEQIGGAVSGRVDGCSSRLLGTLGEAGDATASRLEACIAGLQGQAQDFHAVVGAIVEEASGAVTQTARQAATLVHETLTDVTASLDTSMAQRLEALGTSSRSVVDAITDQVVVIETAVRDELDRLTSFTGGVGEAVAMRIAEESGRGARQIADAVADTAGRLDADLARVEHGAEALERAGESLGAVSRQVADTVADAKAQIGTALEAASGELGAHLVERVEAVWQAYEATFDAALASLTEALDDNVRRKLLEQEAGFLAQADRLVATIGSQLRAELEKAAADLADGTATGVRASLEDFVARLEAGLDGRLQDLETSLGGRMMEVVDVLDGSSRNVEAALDRLGSPKDIEAATDGFAARVEASAQNLEARVAEGMRALEAVLADDSLRAGVFGKVERAALDIARRGEEAGKVLGSCLDDIETRLDARRFADELRTAVAETCEDAAHRLAEALHRTAEREAEAIAAVVARPAVRALADERGPGPLPGDIDVGQPPEDFIQSIRRVIGEVVEDAAVAQLWAHGLVGRKSGFGTTLYTAKGRQLLGQVTRIARADPSFRTAIEAFVDRFETRVRDVARLDRSGALERAELMSAAGKTYTLLAHVVHDLARDW